MEIFHSRVSFDKIKIKPIQKKEEKIMNFIFQRKILFLYAIFRHPYIDDESIKDVLKTLTEREAKVLKMRFGLGRRIYTLKEVGYQLKVTQERIRQIEKKALRKLKHPSRNEKLKKFILK